MRGRAIARNDEEGEVVAEAVVPMEGDVRVEYVYAAKDGRV